MKLLIVGILTVFLPFIGAFECYTCNSESNTDDSKECHEVKETCPKGVESCSMVTYLSQKDDKIHTRKFCTSAGTPIYQYLLFFPGSALCHNLETKNDHVRFGSELQPPPSDLPLRAHRSKRSPESHPPAPPHTQSSTLLCVCSTELCNGGSFTEVLNRSMKNNIDKITQTFENLSNNVDRLQEIQ